MRREGSPWQGLGTVVLKELADHFDSVRMVLLALLMILFAMVPLYIASEQAIGAGEEPFLLLRLFGSGGQGLSVVLMLMFTLPLVAIGLGFDAINGEHSRRTLSRILAQPIYRDALLAGKFIAGLAVLAINLVCLWLLVVGFGLVRLGVPPGGEEFVRSLTFVGLAIVYGGVWLALAMLFSVLFRSPATAALLSLGVWLFMTFLWRMISAVLAFVIAPPQDRMGIDMATGQMFAIPDPVNEAWEQTLSRLSPNQMFQDAVSVILSPTKRSLGPLLDQLSQIKGMIGDAALPLRESLLIAWPLAVGLIAVAIVLFVAAYVAFQRQEVRA
jgi:ABC-2 type transport system permease protein